VEKFKITFAAGSWWPGSLTKEQEEFVKKYLKEDRILVVEFDPNKGTAEVVKQTVQREFANKYLKG